MFADSTNFHRTRSASIPLKIAVTGGAGSGKTSVCNRLKQLGLNVISTDVIAREVVSPGMPVYEAIVTHFGRQFLSSDGTLDRKRLRRLITSDKRQKQALDRLIHPEILRRMRLEIESAVHRGEPVVLVEIPLLFELGLAGEFDFVVMVAAAHEQKIKRLMARDQVSRQDAEALLQTQLQDGEKIKQADFVVKNDGSLQGMISEVGRLFKVLNKKMKKTP